MTTNRWFGTNMKTKWSIALAFIASALLPAQQSFAVEGAAGFYLLGNKTSMAGFVPPPGTYVQSANYFYSGSTAQS